MISMQASLAAMNSASVLERATQFCLYVFQETVASPSRVTESEKKACRRFAIECVARPVRVRVRPQLPIAFADPQRIVLSTLEDLRTRFTAASCLRGSDVKCESTPTANLKSERVRVEMNNSDPIS